MNYLALTGSPWQRAVGESSSQPADWCSARTLAPRIAAWRTWLSSQAEGRWLLFQTDPMEFTAALLALWETGRSAVLPGDNKPATLRRLGDMVAGIIPPYPPQAPVQAPPFQDATRQQRAIPEPLALQAQREAVVLYTSGSTGEPVMQPKRFQQLEDELDQHARLWPLDGCAVVSQVSHQHIYGLLTGILHPLCHGVPFSARDSRYPETLAERLMDAQKAGLAAVVVSSPAQLSRLPEHLHWPAIIRRVFSSGAPLSETDALRSEQLLQAPVIEIYGSTETGGVAWRRQQQSACWTALPCVDWRIEQGKLQVRSTFLEHPEHWWLQSDRASPQDAGFHLLGRADRVAKVGGKRISLTQIENCLSLQEGIRTARCLPLAERDGRLAIVVAMQPESIPRDHEMRRGLVERLRNILDDELDNVAIPRYWRFVEVLPVNSQGKHDNALLTRCFADLDDDRQPRWLGEVSGSEGNVEIHLEVPSRLRYLAGHFPRLPVVPGVVLVQWAIELATEHFGDLGTFCAVERLKFQKILRPGLRFSLHLERRDDGIAFHYDSHHGRHASGRVVFTQGATHD